MIGFLEYTVPLSIKILICLTIITAMLIVYFWEPGRKKMNKRNKSNQALQYIDIDPDKQFAGKDTMLKPEMEKVKFNHHMTLQELDEYVQTLKHNKIRDLDEV